MMAKRQLPPFAVLALTATLWIVPSIGSQGMGTIGERFAHVDRTLVEGGAALPEVRRALRAADAQVEQVLAR